MKWLKSSSLSLWKSAWELGDSFFQTDIFSPNHAPLKKVSLCIKKQKRNISAPPTTYVQLHGAVKIFIVHICWDQWVRICLERRKIFLSTSSNANITLSNSVIGYNRSCLSNLSMIKLASFYCTNHFHLEESNRNIGIFWDFEDKNTASCTIQSWPVVWHKVIIHIFRSCLFKY